jgi:hypothetical protein
VDVPTVMRGHLLSQWLIDGSWPGWLWQFQIEALKKIGLTAYYHRKSLVIIAKSFGSGYAKNTQVKRASKRVKKFSAQADANLFGIASA